LAFGVDVVAASACATLLVLWLHSAASVGSHAVALGTAHGSGLPRAATTQFADGSMAELLGRDSELRVEEEDAHRVVAKLTGGARFRVVHNRQRTFQVQAGEVRVRVLGTVFSVLQLPSGQTQVLVEQGRVEIAWLGGVSELEGGEGGVFPPGDTQPAEPGAPAAEAPSVQGGRPAAPVAASAGRGGRDEAGELIAAADAARLSGHLAEALQLLRSLCDRHAADRRAPVAAFMMGRILVDDMARPAEAAAAFQRARLLWPGGPLVEDALAREAEAWQRAGRSERARAIAEGYLERYPQGRHAGVLRTLLAE
jgi:transmembrane sensor